MNDTLDRHQKSLAELQRMRAQVARLLEFEQGLGNTEKSAEHEAVLAQIDADIVRVQAAINAEGSIFSVPVGQQRIP